MKKILLLFTVVCIGCANQDPQQIVDKALEASGEANFQNKEVTFTFRDKDYGAKFIDGRYHYVRLFKESAQLYQDVVTNEGFYREVNGRKVEIPDSMAAKYSNSVNSVIYFALLPKGLNDPSVNKEYMGSKTIKEKEYHKIKITFDQNGGGVDFEDEFIYWIGKNDNKIDYLAYSYQTEGGGMRFREAYNERMVNGIRFVDYINYEAGKNISLDNIDIAFENGQLKELSRIELESIKVNRL